MSLSLCQSVIEYMCTYIVVYLREFHITLPKPYVVTEFQFWSLLFALPSNSSLLSGNNYVELLSVHSAVLTKGFMCFQVCSSCSLRYNCERAYLVTNKEDEARTIDLMRVFMTYGFDPINGSVENKALLKHKSVKSIVRKLLHEVVRLSAVPIDPNLPPPVIKKRPPKVKQPPPPPKRRVGRDDIEMKKGDWLCPKYVFFFIYSLKSVSAFILVQFV